MGNLACSSAFSLEFGGVCVSLKVDGEDRVLGDVNQYGCWSQFMQQCYRQHRDTDEENENLGVDILNDLETYWEDIKDRLVVSRMVSDSVVKAKDQFKKLKKEIDRIRKGSGSLGLSGILEDNMPEKWIDVDRALDGLRTTLESAFMHAEDMVCLSKSLLFDWRQEREFQAEIEGILIKNCIQSFQEEFEERLWDQNAKSYGNESANWLEMIKEITSFRQELDAISKSLSVPESGHLISHGSLEHRKASVNHISSASLWEGNGKHDDSVTVVPENMDCAQLKHFSKEELFNYFKSEMTKMRRDHELKVQQMTEECFSLKREYLKERGSSVPVRKDKEFDSLRKKIPEVILKLDGILMENEKLAYLNDRLESLSLENRQLRDLLLHKKKN
ncbi:hypothetical protein GH714_041215 [Hevea brasiliensis]|uniref:Uncharacterized protein n=1 Tax=Hevea brasiliensis TaxID=3981 RepID=A0A6A6MZ73_HEVBR|nr:hypothetical protein GH714_041215 [Hevea brasiliensis]